jgi:hypothetical protein
MTKTRNKISAKISDFTALRCCKTEFPPDAGGRFNVKSSRKKQTIIEAGITGRNIKTKKNNL